MKTDINKFKASELLVLVATLAPSVAVSIHWEPDNDVDPDIRKNCDGFDDEDPDDWRAWRSEVRAAAVVLGREVSGSAYLGATWERFGDSPARSNPEISGYLPQMILEAFGDLAKQLPEGHALRSECAAVAETL